MGILIGEKESKKWSESGTNRIAMHGIMGALVSREAGAGMTKGLTGAGLNALLQKELGKIKDKEVHKMASAAIGYLAGGKNRGSHSLAGDNLQLPYP